MYLISVPNLKEIHPWLKVIVLNQCEEEEKCEEKWVIFRNAYLADYISDFLQIWYIKLCIWRA